MNPVPCGYIHRVQQCTCTAVADIAFLGRNHARLHISIPFNPGKLKSEDSQEWRPEKMGSNKAVGRQCLLCSRTSEVHSYHSCMVALMPVHLSPPMAIQLSWYISSSPMACCLSISKWRLPSLPVYHSHNYRYPLVAMVHSLVRSKSCDIIFLEMLSG